MRTAVLGVLWGMVSLAPLGAAPRDRQWAEVAEAVAKHQPRTALGLLKPLETSAFADHAWAEGTKALLMRVRLHNQLWFEEDPFERDAEKPPQPGGAARPGPVRDPFYVPPPRSASSTRTAVPFAPDLFAKDASRRDPPPADPFADTGSDQKPAPEIDFADPGGPLGCVRQIESEWEQVPEPVRPVLRLFQARWLHEYLRRHYSKLRSHTPATPQPGDEMETWDAPRLVAAIAHFRSQALAGREITRKFPASDWSAVFRPGALDDSLRPTLHDLLAHAILEDIDDSRSRRHYRGHGQGFQVMADSPAFDDPEAFLAWDPERPADRSPIAQALPIYQDLLAFHRDDAERSAFLHCDLERRRWAGSVAEGPGKEKRHRAAIRSFIAAHPEDPLSADARQDDAILWLRANRPGKAHHTLTAGAEAFPDHPFGRMCRDFAAHLEKKSLEVSTPASWPPGGDLVSISHKNLDHLWFRLDRLDWEGSEAVMRTGPGIPQTSAELVAWLQQREPVRSWDTALTAPRDFRRHQEQIATPKDLPPGTYLFVISGDRNFAAPEQGLAWTWVTTAKLGIVVDPTATNAEHIGGRVIEVVSGNPLAGVKVDCWQHPPDTDTPRHWQTVTDREGGFRFAPLPEPNRPRALVVAASGRHRVFEWMRVGQRSGVAEKDPTVTMFTDRAVYRPGQPIQFKGIVTESDTTEGRYTTVGGQAVEVALVGPNNQECGKLDLTTNDFGSFSGSFSAPTRSLLGRYAIRVGEREETRVRVEEYKRPKFTVELRRPGKPVVFGEQLEVKGRALSYTEAPIDGAEVEWSVHRRTEFSGWTAWRLQYASGLELLPFKEGRTTTAADGSFTVSFVAEAEEAFDPSMEPVAEFVVMATVTDPTGEKHSKVISTTTGFVNLAAGLEFHYWQEADRAFEIGVRTATLDGDPLPAAGVLRVHRLEQPAACPREPEELFYYGEDTLYDAPLPPPYCWELGEAVHESPVRTALSEDRGDCLASCPVRLPAGYYRVVFETTGTAPHKVVAIEDLQVVDRQAERFPVMLPFHVSTPESRREPGEACELLWGSGLPAARACVEWCRDGTLLKREWSTPGRTQQMFSFTPDESMRGGIHARITQYGSNRWFVSWDRFKVPWSNKKLTVEWERLTSKLNPGAEDIWTAVVRGPDGKPARAEMVATLYDASLDDVARDPFPRKVWDNIPPHSFPVHEWEWEFRRDSPRYQHAHASFDHQNCSGFPEARNSYYDDWCVLKRPYRSVLRGLDRSRPLTAIAITPWGRCWVRERHGHDLWLDMQPYEFYEPPELPSGKDLLLAAVSEPSAPGQGARGEALRRTLDRIRARRDLRETAFFFPHLTSGADGAVRMSFTMPEGLGKWRFLGFAHDTAMRFGGLEGETITAKDLMVQPNPPRFLREGDVLEFPVRIFNQSDREQSGLARFTLRDAANHEDRTGDLGITEPEQAFRIPARQSQTLLWKLRVPEGTGPLLYKALATCGSLSDGEEGGLPVLPRRIAVTDSLALRMRGAGEKRATFAALRDSGQSDTLRHQSLQVQVVSQPAWLAVLALPWLMEYPHQCSEQIFHRYYANALGGHIVRSDPRIRRVFDTWRDTPALDSPLERNQEIAGILLEETPWLQDALGESRQRRHLGELFDEEQTEFQQAELSHRLSELQGDDDLWPWFPGGRGSETITQCIVAGFGRLRAFGVEIEDWPARRAATALDHCLTERFRALRRRAKKEAGHLERNHLNPWVARGLYARSFFLEDCQVAERDREAHHYYLGQARQYWPTLDSRMAAAHLALALWREGEAPTARLITRSLREGALRTAEDGMFWRDSFDDGWWWWQAPIETQALMIEAFGEIDQDAEAVDDCRAWLIQQKRARAWPTTTGTADAIHALLSDRAGSAAGHGAQPAPPLSSEALLRITLGGTPVDPGPVEAGTGFYQHRFPAPEVKPALGDIVLSKEDPGIAWASVHWQYLEDLDKLASHETNGLELKKTILVRRTGPSGPALEPVNGPLRVGDELVTRLVLRNEHDMEFVHLKDARGSGTEPAGGSSGYRRQAGLTVYEETRDTATHFFIESLPAGTHVLETGARIQHAGLYQSGIAEIRCMYAPGFHARSGSVQLEAAGTGS